MVKVEIIYVALDKTIVQKALSLRPGATVSDALHTSGIYTTNPETREMSIGIYAKSVSLNQVLKEGDRIEIYRPLVLDPKEKRRQRAKR